MKTVLFSAKSYDIEFFNLANKDFKFEIHYLETPLNADTVLLADGFAAICVFVNDQLDAEMITALAKGGIKLIALRCAGFNNVDLEAAAKHQIKVVRVPAYSPQAVAEHAVALIMTLNRKTHKAYNRIREGNFSLERLTGFDLYGKTIGVIGTGKIGAAFCQIMLGFGCKVVAYDKYPNQTLADQGIMYTSLETLFEQSDIISLHCPLNPETQHIINPDSLSLMKNGVMLINTSRGALIDSKAVIQALKHRKLGYLGIDVYEQEESLFFKDLSETIIQDDDIMRLMSFPNVLITAHQAFFTENALNQIASTTLRNIDAFEKGQVLDNEVSVKLLKG